jgi:predicted SAM-dependent methyltransferase
MEHGFSSIFPSRLDVSKSPAESFLDGMYRDLKQHLKRSELLVGLVHRGRRIRHLSRLPFRPWQIHSYLSTHSLRKLQIGSGTTSLDGWLCTDFEPVSGRVVYLDATQKFPFRDNTFDYVYSEHMIEHIPYGDGIAMLSECHRIMKAGGAIRIATPDLAVLLGLRTNDPDGLQRRYIEWISERYLDTDASSGVHVINNAFRSWGHQFLYDGEVLQAAMERAGFRNVKRYPHSHSDDPNLRGLESHGRSVGNEEMNVFETMVFEGICTK